MKLWKIWGMEDLVLGAGTMTAALTGFNIHATSGAPASADLVFFNDRKWWHGTVVNSSPMAQIAGNGFALTGKLVFGGRYCTDTPTLTQFGAMYNTAVGSLAGNMPVSNYGVVANKEHYIEVVLDFVALTHQWYVNGNPTPAFSQTYTSAQFATIPVCSFMFGGTGAGVGNWWARDMSFREYGPSETYVPWKNAITRRVSIAALNAPGYVSSNGDTKVNVVNGFFTDTTTSYTSPTIDNGSPVASPVLTADLLLQSDNLGTIQGMELFDTVKSSQAPAGTLTPQLKQNSVLAAGVPAVLTAAFQNRKSLGAFQTMPDGSAMTRAKINQSQLILTAS